MQIVVPSKAAAALGNALIEKVRHVQRHRDTTGKLPADRYLTHGRMVARAGLTIQPNYTGPFLDIVLNALHRPGMPEPMRGLTLFVTTVDGKIDYSAGYWFGINETNSLQYRQAVLAFDWSGVTFEFAKVKPSH